MRSLHLSFFNVFSLVLSLWLCLAAAQLCAEGNKLSEETLPFNAIADSEYASEDDSDSTDINERQGISHAVMRSIDKRRGNVGGLYKYTITTTDNFFAGRNLERELNESYLRLDYKSQYNSEEGYSGAAKLKARADFPNTERRFRLILDNLGQESSDDQDGANAELDSNTSQAQLIGVELGREAQGERWKPSWRLGVKMGSQPSLYTHLRIQKRWGFANGWSTFVRIQPWYIGSSGVGNTSKLELDKKHNAYVYSRLLSDFTYRDEYRAQDRSLQYMLTQKLSPTATLNYRLGERVTHDSDGRDGRYFYSINSRNLIYEDWLYLSFSAERYLRQQSKIEDWQYSLSVMLQVFFTE